MENKIFAFLFGDKGGFTKKQLNQMTQREKFSDFLPWVAYDPETKVYLNKDNTIGFIWECIPLVFAGERTTSTLEGFLRIPFPEGSIAQFLLYADPYIEPFVRYYENCKIREGIVKDATTKFFAKFLTDGTKGIPAMEGVPTRNFRLFVSVKMPVSSNANIKEIYGTATECLKGANLHPDDVTPEILIDWLRRLFNQRTFPDSDHYDEEIPIAKQIILSETVIDKDFSQIRIGNRSFRCITPKTFPKEISNLTTNRLVGEIYGSTVNIDQIRTPFIFAVNVVFQNLKAKLHVKCNFVLQQQGFGSFAPSLARKKEEYLWAVDELEKGTRFFQIIPIVWVWGDDEKTAIDSVARTKRIWESQGFIMQEDKGILPILFLSALPFGLYNVGSNIEQLERDFIASTDTIATFLPVQADFAGGGKPIQLFVSRKGQLSSLDIFDKQATNHNMFVCAASGEGKSFLVNSMVCNYYAANNMIRIIDIGGSYKKMTKMFGARYLSFDQFSDVCLNPFGNIIDPKFDLPVIASILAQMVYSSQNILPNETEMTLLKNAITWAYETEGKKASVDVVYHYLYSFPRHATNFDFDCSEHKECAVDIKALAHTLAFNLHEFTSEGRFGRWFNGETTFDISKDEFVVLELEELKPQKDLFQVVTLQVINAVTHDLYLSDRSKPRLIVFDESWQFLKEGAILASVIEEGYRRARKYGGSFTIITQSILDLLGFGNVGDVIRANSAFKFYLASNDFEKAKNEKLIDYDDFTMQLLKSVKSNKPKYSEIFMDTPFGVGVTRLIVDPFSYYMYTSDAKEIAEIERLVDEGLSYEEAIMEMIKNYRN